MTTAAPARLTQSQTHQRCPAGPRIETQPANHADQHQKANNTQKPRTRQHPDERHSNVTVRGAPLMKAKRSRRTLEKTKPSKPPPGGASL